MNPTQPPAADAAPLSEEPVEPSFGLRVKEVREKAGLSLTKLAEAAGIARSYLHEMESGKTKAPGVYVALRLAAALGVSVEQLAFGSDVAATPNPSLEVVELRRRLMRIERIAKGEDL